MTDQTTVKPLAGVLEGDVKFELGEESRTALRREHIRALTTAEGRVKETFEVLPFLNGPEARPRLEELSEALVEADRIANVLWWLAPRDDKTGSGE